MSCSCSGLDPTPASRNRISSPDDLSSPKCGSASRLASRSPACRLSPNRIGGSGVVGARYTRNTTNSRYSSEPKDIPTRLLNRRLCSCRVASVELAPNPSPASTLTGDAVIRGDSRGGEMPTPDCLTRSRLACSCRTWQGIQFASLTAPVCSSGSRHFQDLRSSSAREALSSASIPPWNPTWIEPWRSAQSCRSSLNLRVFQPTHERRVQTVEGHA